MTKDRERHARILCRIWDDNEWKGLSPRAQWFYLLLTSQASLNRVGVIGLTYRRWSGLASGSQVAEQITLAQEELQKAKFVIVDSDTEELLVRSYMRNDGVASQPNVLICAVRQAFEVHSPIIRAAIVVELRRLENDVATMAAEALEKGLPNPSAKGSDNPSRGVPKSKGSGKGSSNPGGRGKGSSTSSVGSNSSPSAPKRGTKAPDHLLVTVDMRTWAKSKGVTVDLDSETEAFLDHHRAKGSAFKDWASAWRYWMRNSIKFGTQRPGSQLAIVDDFQLPTPPREIRDDPDPEVYHQWARDQRAARQAVRA